MDTITKTATELRPGDRYIVQGRTLTSKTLKATGTCEFIVTVVAVGLAYADRYGDRYVSLTVTDSHGTRMFDTYATATYEVLA